MSRARASLCGAAALVLCAAAALSFYGAGAASALTPAAPPQVSGTVLATGLLPAGDFGAGFTWVPSGAPSSGGDVLPPSAGLSLADVDCSDFESVIYLEAYGQTAGALESFTNPAWQSGNPDIWDGGESVFQFANARAAASFYQRAYAKYEACQPLTVPQPSDTAVGGGALDLSTMSITRTTVAGYRAFEQIQSAARSQSPGWNFFRNTLTVLADADVYQIFDYSGTDDEPSPALMAELIQRVRQLR